MKETKAKDFSKDAQVSHLFPASRPGKIARNVRLILLSNYRHRQNSILSFLLVFRPMSNLSNTLPSRA